MAVIRCRISAVSGNSGRDKFRNRLGFSSILNNSPSEKMKVLPGFTGRQKSTTDELERTHLLLVCLFVCVKGRCLEWRVSAAIKRPTWSLIKLPHVQKSVNTHTHIHAKSDALLWTNRETLTMWVRVCVCVRAHVCVCWRKASSILTNVCFWWANAVLMFVIGLF